MPIMQPSMPNLPQPYDAGQQETQNWSREISYQSPSYEMQGSIPGMIPNTMPGINVGTPPGQPSAPGAPEFSIDLTQTMVDNGDEMRGNYRGSLRAMLAQNIGHYIIATFLIGTQSPVSWEGFLHSVGNDYLVIFQPDQGRYITGDFYALKFVEFHGTKGVVPPCAGYRRRDGQHLW